MVSGRNPKKRRLKTDQNEFKKEALKKNIIRLFLPLFLTFFNSQKWVKSPNFLCQPKLHNTFRYICIKIWVPNSFKLKSCEFQVEWTSAYIYIINLKLKTFKIRKFRMILIRLWTANWCDSDVVRRFHTDLMLILVSFPNSESSDRGVKNSEWCFF